MASLFPPKYTIPSNLSCSYPIFETRSTANVLETGFNPAVLISDYSDESVHPIPTKVDSRFDDDFLG